MGQNPSFPGLAETTPASSNLDSSTRIMKALKDIDDVRVKYRKYECDEKLKKTRSQKINPYVEKNYSMGDPVIFRDTKKKEWKHGTALVRFGKTLYLKFGNWLRRVPIDTVMPDPIGAEKVEETYIEPADEDEERFVEEEVPVVELEKDLEKGALMEKVENLQKLLIEEKLMNEKLTNENQAITTTTPDESNSQNGSKEETLDKRTKRRINQKKKKNELKKIFPTLGQRISFKEYGSDTWKHANVSGVFKKTSIHKNLKQLTFDDGFKTDVDFENTVENWKPFHTDDVECEADLSETYFLSSIMGNNHEDIYDSFPVNLVPRREYGHSDVQKAMKDEIEKYHSFNAFEEVIDEGQDSLPVRWVVTRHEVDGKNQPLKARLCVRGDLEKGKDNICSDSPTVGKETLKLALAIAANEGFEVKSGDIKSAYLQGMDIQRRLFVKPPPEAGLSGKLWLLKKGAYGISDGGRLFNHPGQAVRSTW